MCPEHYGKDERRSHLDPNIPYLLDQFQAVQFSELETISLKPELKRQLRKVIDQIYKKNMLGFI